MSKPTLRCRACGSTDVVQDEAGKLKRPKRHRWDYAEETHMIPGELYTCANGCRCTISIVRRPAKTRGMWQGSTVDDIVVTLRDGTNLVNPRPMPPCVPRRGFSHGPSPSLVIIDDPHTDCEKVKRG